MPITHLLSVCSCCLSIYLSIKCNGPKFTLYSVKIHQRLSTLGRWKFYQLFFYLNSSFKQDLLIWWNIYAITCFTCECLLVIEQQKIDSNSSSGGQNILDLGLQISFMIYIL